jgi:hypothetical protein
MERVVLKRMFLEEIENSMENMVLLSNALGA